MLRSVLISVSLTSTAVAAQTETQLPLPLLPGSQHGAAVAGTRDLIVTGAPEGGRVGQSPAGRATVFRFSAGSWVPTPLPLPPEVSDGDHFGHAVAINDVGTIIAVGAPFDDTGADDAGLVALYVWNASSQSFEIDEVVLGSSVGGRLGTSVDLDGECAVLGEPFGAGVMGTAAVLCRNDMTNQWDVDATLLGADFAGGFGSSVSLDGEALIVGSPLALGSVGRADIYEKLGGAWQLVHTTLGSVGDGNYGAAVAVDGSNAAIGSPDAFQPIFFNNRGRVALLRRDALGDWSDAALDWDQSANAEANIGQAVALRGDVALVGGPGITSIGPGAPQLGSDAGFVHVLHDIAGTWKRVGMFSAIDVAAGDRYGAALAFAGDLAVVGAPGSDSVGPDVGTAYVRRLEDTFVVAELSPSGGAGLDMTGLGGGNASLEIMLTGGTCAAPMPLPATLVLGFGVLNAPFKGGTLVPQPTVLIDQTLSCTPTAGGQASYETSWPVGLPDLTFFVQLWVPDASVPTGWVSSEGLSVTVSGD